ncbi:DUF397 domain-containing protein [Streptomyces sp. DH18]|uniref:DUF397 domain-containing protein n=1 Tax=Streptomyces sp. DH18 TaxID=3040126 RepID=UPI002442F7D6|nr:DUF397 domain-containing protein [Streptomyces sp. DH18]MDG9685962.1 DUF397 domain-containing protein [Streptomyces sp. DH18]
MSDSQSPTATSDLDWFKSSYSGSGGGECVEGAAADSSVYVRDSKPGQGLALRVGAGEWTEFVSFATRG